MKIEAYTLCDETCDLHKDCASLGLEEGYSIMPQALKRSWMDEKTLAFSYKCLPLRIGNELGWQINCPADIRVRWEGEYLPDSLKIEYRHKADEDKYGRSIESHFGHGIITFNIPYLFRTPKKKSLYVRGPTNWYKEYCQYLDAVIETDWINQRFSYNIKINKKNEEIYFYKGEPLCSFIPLDLSTISNTTLVYKNIKENTFLNKKFHEFVKQRGLLDGKNDLQYLSGGYNSIFDKNKEIGCPYLHFKNLNLKTTSVFKINEKIQFLKEKLKEHCSFYKNILLRIAYKFKNLK